MCSVLSALVPSLCNLRFKSAIREKRNGAHMKSDMGDGQPWGTTLEWVAKFSSLDDVVEPSATNGYVSAFVPEGKCNLCSIHLF